RNRRSYPLRASMPYLRQSRRLARLRCDTHTTKSPAFGACTARACLFHMRGAPTSQKHHNPSLAEFSRSKVSGHRLLEIHYSGHSSRATQNSISTLGALLHTELLLVIWLVHTQ